MTNREIQKLARIVEQDLPALAKNIIVPDGRGYEAFGCYRIIKRRNTYRVEKYSSYVADFTQARTAISWCVADKYQQHNLADKILRLETKHRLLSDDLQARDHVAKKLRSPGRDGIAAKIDRKRQVLQQTKFHLDKCVNLAKYWQLRGFDNETSRTGRTSSQRTGR